MPAAISRSDPALAGLGNTLECGGESLLLCSSQMGWADWCCKGEGHCSRKSSSVMNVMVLKAHQEYSECLLPERFASYPFIYLYKELDLLQTVALVLVL